MANLQKRLDVTELDFDTIKSNLINYFKNTEPFKDYDYSGSGLNQLLDVLAYNTHYNAMLAHTAVNESFIDTAQIRSSVVSNAKLLGYVPRSKTAPAINVKVDFGVVTDPINPNTYVTLPRGSNFKTTYGDNSFIYTTLDDYKLEYDGSSRYTGTNILLKEGSLRRNRFALSNNNDKNVYQIDDDNIDISSMIVRVYDNSNGSSFEVYRNFTTIQLTNESNLATAPLYFLSENAYGKYQISFSNSGAFGKRPPNLGVVEIEYLTTTGSASNGAKTFKYVGPTILYTSSQSTVTPMSSVDSSGNIVFEKSFGGNEKESIDSIRLNAPTSFVAQNRAVTANDYKSLIYSNFSIAKSIAVWGGENNVPPQYGNVYISIQPQTDDDHDGITLTPAEKQAVLGFLDSKKILSISPVLVDPQRITLVLDVLFKYNNNLSVLSKNQLENKVYNVVDSFNRDTLDSFEKVFRHSTLLRAIDTSDPAILNSLVRVFVSKKINIKSEQTINNQTLQPERIVVDFGTSLTVLDGKTIASFQGYTYRGRTIYLGDEPSNVANIRNVFQYTLENGSVSKFKSLNSIDVPPIGTIDLDKGILTIDSLEADEDVTVYIDVIPSSNDIAPKRNQLLTVDMDRLNLTADIDIIASGGSSRSVDYQPFSRER
jgi:hypothetical protein